MTVPIVTAQISVTLFVRRAVERKLPLSGGCQNWRGKMRQESAPIFEVNASSFLSLKCAMCRVEISSAGFKEHARQR